MPQTASWRQRANRQMEEVKVKIVRFLEKLVASYSLKMKVKGKVIGSVMKKSKLVFSK